MNSSYSSHEGFAITDWLFNEKPSIVTKPAELTVVPSLLSSIIIVETKYDHFFLSRAVAVAVIASGRLLSCQYRDYRKLFMFCQHCSMQCVEPDHR